MGVFIIKGHRIKALRVSFYPLSSSHILGSTYYVLLPSTSQEIHYYLYVRLSLVYTFCCTKASTLKEKGEVEHRSRAFTITNTGVL
jgi:hypothetical protein